MRRGAGLLWVAALLGLLLTGPVVAQEPSAGVGRVVAEIERGDCAAAARELNAALPKADAELLLLAGGMFDEGVCLKANWERASRFYGRAAEAGSSLAVLRLAAGHGSVRGTDDLGATLWWSHRAEMLPAACQVSGFTPRMEPERFVAVVQGWAPGQAATCAYAGSLMSAVAAEVRHGDAARKRSLQGMQGTVRLSLVAAQGRFTAEMVGEAPSRREWKIGESSPTGDASLIGYLQTVTAKEARQFKPPAAPAGDWTVAREFVFSPK